MDIPPETIILIVAVLIVAAVAYLQLRYIRSRKQVKVDGAIEQDDAYNAVTTTKAVAASLRQAGRDTTEADVLIYQAENAYDRREFANSRELADRAKTALRNSKERDLLTCPVPPPDGEAEEKEVPASAVRKLPPNYLESKFVIDTVNCMLPDATDEAREEAQRSLVLAQTSFDGQDYNEALKHALKAKRALGGEQKPPKPTVRTEIIKAPRPVREVPLDSCRKCAAPIGPEDGFCHACGSSKAVRSCPSCSREASEEDVFCRKCGARL